MRAPLSCYNCRQTKRKCNRTGIGETCDLCKARNLGCSLEATVKNGESRPQHFEALQDQSSRSLGLSHSSTIDLVELYLSRFHGGTHSIFHPDTLRAKVRSGNIKHGLLTSICALGSKFSSLPDGRALETRLVEEAKRVVKADLENICLENVQACLLLTLLSAGESQSSSEALFIRLFPPCAAPSRC